MSTNLPIIIQESVLFCKRKYYYSPLNMIHILLYGEFHIYTSEDITFEINIIFHLIIQALNFLAQSKYQFCLHIC